MRHTPLILSLLSATSLLACGGGGGSDPVPVAQVNVTQSTGAYALTAGNYADTGKEVLGATRVVASVASQSNVVWDQVLSMPALFATKLDSRTDSCAQGGSVDIYIHDKNKDGLGSAGDDIVMQFNGCAKSELATNANGTVVAVKATYNGALTLALNEAIVGDLKSYPQQVNVTVGLGTLSRTLTAGTVSSTQTAKGILTIVSALTAANSGTQSVSSKAATGGFEATSGSLKRTFSDVSVSTVLSATGVQTTQAGTLLVDGKSLTFSTTAPFLAASVSSYPSQGTLVATGASGATVTLRAADATTVAISFAADGQTASTTSSWSAIN